MGYQAAKRFKKERVYRSFHWQKRLPKSELELSSSGSLLMASWRFFKKNWMAFTALIVITFALGWLLIFSGVKELDLEAAKSELSGALQESFKNKLIVGLSLIPYLLEEMGNQIIKSLGWFMLLGLLLSASCCWLIRQLKVDKKAIRVSILDAIYFGSAQIVPYFLISLLLFIQFLPAIVVASFASYLRTTGVLTTNWEHLGAWFVVLSVFFLSFYWIVGSLFSLIIIHLPKTRPLEAWQSSLNLTHRRRRPIVGRLLLGLLLWVFLSLFLIWLSLMIWPTASLLIFYGINLVLAVLFYIYCFELYLQLLYSTKLKESHDI